MSGPAGDIRDARSVRWIKAARKDFHKFPATAQRRMAIALRLASMGQKADNAKPMSGVGPGVFEIALKYRTDAYRAVYALQLNDDIWVLHAFKKKSKSGIETPKKEVETIKSRIKMLKEMLKNDR